MDVAVLKVQKWLNSTYGGINGFDEAPEDGISSWNTIFSLREALQHEMGMSDLSAGFGPETKSYASNLVFKLRPGFEDNIVKVIQGAFWVKGITPNDFSTSFTEYTQKAFEKMQLNAGLSATGNVSVPLLAALFDMSAFSLVQNGDSKVREMQQNLNAQYASELDEIMPCDGIYQRATNTALIYALQRNIGFSANTANGNYGPGTISATPTIYPGNNSNLVKIIQYGLYVNGYYNSNFNTTFGDEMASEIIKFRKFMKLAPYTSTADLTVIKGLLTSNGNTNRDSNAFDTSTRLSAQQAKQLKAFDFDIVGRYLTGSVGVGNSKRPKDLTHDEIENITSAGLSIFPIYEDGGYDIDYFTHNQGVKDGYIAMQAAAKFGFPAASTIYFAVDVDIQNGDINNTVIPYFEGLAKAMKDSVYNIGVYGTRNVCSRVSDAVQSVLYSYAADMSYGWSGNLGFKMPKNWAFDQFIEYPAAGVAIDQLASSGRDTGAKEFKVDKNQLRLNLAREIVDTMDNLSPLRGSLPNLKVDSPAIEVTTPLVDYYVSVGSEYKNTKYPANFTINNGKLTNDLTEAINTANKVFPDGKNVDLKAGFNAVAPLINKGNIQIGMGTRELWTSIKLTINSSIEVDNDNSIETSITIEVYFKSGGLGFTETDFNKVYNNAENFNTNEGLEPIAKILGVTFITAASLLGMAVFAISFGSGAGEVATGVALLGILASQ